MFALEWIRKSVEKKRYYYSQHGDQERQNDGLTIAEVEEAMGSGVILEQYPDEGRGKSCLVAGFTNSGKPIHAVCGRRGDDLVIITVYVPKPPKFKSPFERGSR